MDPNYNCLHNPNNEIINHNNQDYIAKGQILNNTLLLTYRWTN